MSEVSPSHTISHPMGQLQLQRCQTETDPHCDLRQDTEQGDCANSHAVTRGSEFPTDDPFSNLTIAVGQNAQREQTNLHLSLVLPQTSPSAGNFSAQAKSNKRGRKLGPRLKEAGRLENLVQSDL